VGEMETKALGVEVKMSPPLDGKTWLKYSISVWDDIKKSPEERALPHPAIYPVALVERLLQCYLWRQGVVLDPFVGSGSTLVAARKLGHSGVGFDIVGEFLEIARQRLLDKSLFESGAQIFLIDKQQELSIDLSGGAQFFYLVLDDALNIQHYLKPETVDIVITSPPYWNVLRRERTADLKQARYYSDLSTDIGNIEGYLDYIGALKQVFEKIFPILKPKCYCIVNVMDLRAGSVFYPVHADLIYPLQEVGYKLEDIIVWDRRAEYNSLRPLGYPYKFIVNKVHEYLLVFWKGG